MMAWLAATMVAGFVWNRLDDERRLRATRRLLRELRAENVAQRPESPSPHQLLGDIARPLAPSKCADRFRGCDFTLLPHD